MGVIHDTRHSSQYTHDTTLVVSTVSSVLTGYGVCILYVLATGSLTPIAIIGDWWTIKGLQNTVDLHPSL
jgi:hypothetical protein